MSAVFGEHIKISIFGESHGPAIGVTAEGFDAGFKINVEALQEFLSLRAPGGRMSTKRKEPDIVKFLSGVKDDVICGSTLTAIIENTDTRSGDYSNLYDIPRPGHADYTAQIKYKGSQDVRGGGHFSGRLTAPLCIAGGIAKQILAKKGIEIYARIKSIGTLTDEAPTAYPKLSEMKKIDLRFPVYNQDKAEAFENIVEEARMNGDSLGGVIECAVFGVPAGFGGPLFEGIEGRISQAVFGIPAVKGIEFGSGFDGSKMYGSENNDGFYFDDEGNVKTYTNNHGGILGGVSSGMPIYFSVAFKPTPSIAKKQKSISLKNKENTDLEIKGRHDPCVVLRAVPCVISAAALTIYDLLKE
ncbi:MAG: chorismate synthase [Ruminococcaceae bacterium]|nr:chorismate synthase [Oscillospiraceae bacterium]